jgi:hypothetical protein
MTTVGNADLFEFSAAGSADVVEGDGSTAEENEREGQGREGERELVAVLAHQSVMEMHFRDGDRHIDADGEGGGAGKETDENERPAKELGKGGEISSPGGQAKAVNELSVVLKAAENFVVSVTNHDSAQSEAHHQQRERLQTIEVAHVIPPGKDKTDYSRQWNPGKCAGRVGSGKVCHFEARFYRARNLLLPNPS